MDIKTKVSKGPEGELSRAPGALPAKMTRAEFARLLEVDAALVTRWAQAGRLELDDDDQVLVAQSLARWLHTADPSRGGRGIGKPGTFERIKALLSEQAATKVQPSTSGLLARIEALRGQLADAKDQLARERAFRRSGCIDWDELAQRLPRLTGAIAAEFTELRGLVSPADFDRRLDKLVSRHIYRHDEATIAEFDDPEEWTWASSWSEITAKVHGGTAATLLTDEAP